MTNVLMTVLVIVIISSLIGAILYYAPFIPPMLKTWGVWVVGAVGLVLIVLQLLTLLPGVAN